MKNKISFKVVFVLFIISLCTEIGALSPREELLSRRLSINDVTGTGAFSSRERLLNRDLFVSNEAKMNVTQKMKNLLNEMDKPYVRKNPLDNWFFRAYLVFVVGALHRLVEELHYDYYKEKSLTFDKQKSEEIKKICLENNVKINYCYLVDKKSKNPYVEISYTPMGNIILLSSDNIDDISNLIKSNCLIFNKSFKKNKLISYLLGALCSVCLLRGFGDEYNVYQVIKMRDESFKRG